jgi:hypothetical protein
MIKNLALYFGIVLTAVGVLGFVPGVTSDGLLLGIFQVDMLHNIIHLATGIVGILVGTSMASYASLYFKVFGIVYGLVTVVGFVQGDTVLGLIMVNMADNILHVAIAAVALYIGFGMKSASAMSSSSSMGGMSSTPSM